MAEDFNSGLPRNNSRKWSEQDSNPGPPDCESDTLTKKATLPQISDRERRGLFYCISIWNRTKSLQIKPEHIFKAIDVFNASRELRISLVKDKFIFDEVSPSLVFASSMLKVYKIVFCSIKSPKCTDKYGKKHSMTIFFSFKNAKFHFRWGTKTAEPKTGDWE